MKLDGVILLLRSRINDFVSIDRFSDDEILDNLALALNKINVAMRLNIHTSSYKREEFIPNRPMEIDISDMIYLMGVYVDGVNSKNYYIKNFILKADIGNILEVEYIKRTDVKDLKKNNFEIQDLLVQLVIYGTILNILEIELSDNTYQKRGFYEMLYRQESDYVRGVLSSFINPSQAYVSKYVQI